jgi:hypothetical protein
MDGIASVCNCPTCVAERQREEKERQDQYSFARGMFLYGFTCGVVSALIAYCVGQLMGGGS